MLKWLLKSLLILAVFVPFAAALPLASVILCRTPDGAQFLFWTGPWSCCFWVLIYSQLSAAPWRQGRDAVYRWREANGGLLHTSIRATGWMFGALFFSYVAEFLMIFLVRPSASAHEQVRQAESQPVDAAAHGNLLHHIGIDHRAAVEIEPHECKIQRKKHTDQRPWNDRL
jgi:hypothetical protein